MIYAIADLHGRFDLLKEAVNAIEKDSTNDSNTTVITLGDYIDRGPDSKSIIDYLMNRGSNWISLMGNHEAMMLETITKPLNPDWWLGNGGDTTLWSYGGKVKASFRYGYYPTGYDPHVVPQEHINWLQKLPSYYETEKQVFVHAGIPFPDVPLDKQDEEKMTWMLYGPQDHGGWQGKHIVHGHHQFADGPHEWSGRTDLDTFAWNTGRLVIGVFDDSQGKALRYIEVLGDDYEGNSG